MKSKDQQLLEEAYTSINEGNGNMVTIEIPAQLWKHALNAHKLPNSAEVLGKIMGDVVNLYHQKEKTKREEQADFHDYMTKVQDRATSVDPDYE